MRRIPALAAVVVSTLPFPIGAGAALAADKCNVKVIVGGKPAELKHCALAVYDQQGATLLFSQTPIGAEERQLFERNSDPKDKDPSGKPRTMMHMAFCPGGGKPAANPAAVRTVELSLSSAASPLLQRQWVLSLPADKDLRFAALSGSLAPGGRLAGKVTGAKTVNGEKYSWDADFDLAVPAKPAAAGPGCG